MLVVHYASRSLNVHKAQHPITDKECNAVVFAVEKFKQYVELTHFFVVTDHSALAWLRDRTDPQGRIARWLVKLSCYHFTVIHRKSAYLMVPDFLSKLPYYKPFDPDNNPDNNSSKDPSNIQQISAITRSQSKKLKEASNENKRNIYD